MDDLDLISKVDFLSSLCDLFFIGGLFFIVGGAAYFR